MSVGRTVIAVAFTAAGAWALAWSSGAGVPWHTGESELRLSLSARPERIETCRVLSAAELEARPVHMRRATECEGRSASYRLQVEVDGAPFESTTVHGSGARGDRSVILLRSYALSEGRRHVRVLLARTDVPDPRGDTVAVRSNVLARSLSLDTMLTVAPGTVTLVTYDATTMALVLKVP